MRFSPMNKTLRQVIAVSVTSLLLLALVPMYPASRVQAFLPYNYQADFLGSESHQSITEHAIKAIDGEFFSINRLTNSMKKAMEEIATANAKTDDFEGFSGSERNQAEAHFDGEQFGDSQERIKIFMSTAITALGENDVKRARSLVGRALHTLQDFYSHSNWIELGNSNPNKKLTSPNQFENQPLKSTMTCTDCTRTTCLNCDNTLITTELTSGYFGGDKINNRKLDKPSHKCSHGGAGDSSAKGLLGSGINKDSLDCALSPHELLHPQAASVATEATKDFFRQMRDLSNLKKMRLLLGVNVTLGFAIDTTGSMQDEIALVRQQVIQIVNSRVGTPLEPDKYVLAPFNDPLVGPPFVTDEPEAFKNRVGALTAVEGGDCPELAYTALLQALPLLDEGGEIIVYTDAAPKDGVLFGFAFNLAEARDVKITYGLTGSCSPIDPSYYSMARGTGGQVFVYDPLQSAEAAKLMDFLTRPDAVDVMAIEDTLSGTAKAYTVPVDSTMTRVTFSVSGTTNVVVKRPDGSNVQPVDPDVSIASLSGGAIYSISSPVSGAWSVTVNGFGSFNVRVAGESKLSLTSFNFVEERGRPGHKGDFPVTGSPIASQLSQVDALISAEDVSTAQFELRTPGGAVLQSLTLSEVPTLTGLFKEFYGDLTVPGTSYLTYVKGLDVNGKDYQRVVPGTTKPQTIKLTAPAIPDLHPGEITTYKLQVKNFGAGDSFQLSGHDDLFIRSISPASFTLNTNESVDVTVELEPPPDTPHGYADTLTFLAQSTGASGASNYANAPMLVTIGRTIALGEVTPRVVVGDSDLLIEPGEVAALSIQLLNQKGLNLSEVVGTLTTETAGVTITSGTSAYFDLPLLDATSLPTGNGVNRTPYAFAISDPSLQLIEFALSVMHAGRANPQVFYFAVSTTLPGPPVVISYTGPPVAIPDGNVDSDGPPVDIPMTVSGLSGPIADINFRIDGSFCTAAAGATTVGIDHTYVVDLVVKLTSPQGTTVTLIDGAGGGLNDGNNFCQTVLDDEGGLTLIDLILPVGPPPLGPPYTGMFIPEFPLAAFKGEDANGIWTLTVIDRFAEGTGNVRGFSLVITAYQ